MPVLTWIGKDKVVNHDKELPFRVLKPVKELSVGENSENLLIEGDNLEALKALMPFYYGKVKCIYIDPPYNTGNEKWIYNDKVNSPQIRAWLNKVVGGQDEDLCRHDKWLCMMYPRLKLLRDLLADDGLIFISIDDNEMHYLRMLMDDIFGEKNFIANIAWEKRFTRSNNAKLFGTSKEYIISFRKSDAVSLLREARTEKSDSIYSNPDNDPRGVWTSVSYVNPATKEQRKNLVYKIKNPITGEEVEHPTNAWKFEYDQYLRHAKENSLFWGKNGGNKYPRLKKFLSEVSAGMVPTDLWKHGETGTTDEGTKDLFTLLGIKAFDNPKPVRLIKRIVSLATNKDNNDIVLDSFSGSGSTGQAVIEANKEDGGNRKFILVELEKNIAKNVTAKRLKKVIEKENNKEGFQYLDLNGELYDVSGFVNPDAHYEDMAAYIYFTETKSYLEIPSIKRPYIGSQSSRHYFLFFEGKDNNILDEKTLMKTDGYKGNKVIYADKCLLDEEYLLKKGIIFKQIPYELKKY